MIGAAAALSRTAGGEWSGPWISPRTFALAALLLIPLAIVLIFFRQRRSERMHTPAPPDTRLPEEKREPVMHGISSVIRSADRPGLVFVDSGGFVTEMNREAQRLLDVNRGDAVGIRAAALPCLGEEERDRLAQSGPLGPELWVLEHATGERIRVAATFTPVDSETAGEDGGVLTLLDASGLRDTSEAGERALHDRIAASSLAIMSTVVRGFAHDLNNLLAGIIGAASLGEAVHPAEDHDGRRFRAILSAAERAASISDELLQASAMRETSDRPLDPVEEVTEITEALRSVLPRAVSLEVSTGRSIPMMMADRSLLRQIFYSLALRSSELLEGRGRISISVEYVGDPGTDPRFSGKCGLLCSIPCVSVSLNDGRVVPLELRDLLESEDSDPLEIEKRFGAAIASVYQAVRAQRGMIIFTREPRSSTFRVLLRAAEEGARPVGTEEEEEISGSGISVLVAEEETLVRETTRQILEHYGFLVAGAGSGDEALAVFEHEGFDVLILDVNMQGTPSQEVARICRERWPDMAILFTSGYESISAGDLDLDGPGIGFIRKPYMPEALALKILDILGIGREA
jgi:CheY-like chemotaxis protein/nitrogen-specific signal transduction histidine kinase